MRRKQFSNLQKLTPNVLSTTCSIARWNFLHNRAWTWSVLRELCITCMWCNETHLGAGAHNRTSSTKGIGRHMFMKMPHVPMLSFWSRLLGYETHSSQGVWRKKVFLPYRRFVKSLPVHRNANHSAALQQTCSFCRGVMSPLKRIPLKGTKAISGQP